MEIENPERARMSFDNLLVTPAYEKEMMELKSFEHIAKSVKYFTDVILKHDKNKSGGAVLDVNDFIVRCSKTGKTKGYVINILIKE